MTGRARRRPDGERERHRSLFRLRTALGRLRAQLGSVQAELRELAAAEATRRLSADETRRVTRVRLDSEGLRLELAALHQEFERLRREAPGPP